MTDDEVHAEVQKAINALSKLRAHVAAHSNNWSTSATRGYTYALANDRANRAWTALHDLWSELIQMQREFTDSKPPAEPERVAQSQR